jgi:hypothetical protein
MKLNSLPSGFANFLMNRWVACHIGRAIGWPVLPRSLTTHMQWATREVCRQAALLSVGLALGLLISVMCNEEIILQERL